MKKQIPTETKIKNPEIQIVPVGHFSKKTTIKQPAKNNCISTAKYHDCGMH